jgi:hypothetical protein
MERFSQFSGQKKSKLMMKKMKCTILLGSKHLEFMKVLTQI